MAMISPIHSGASSDLSAVGAVLPTLRVEVAPLRLALRRPLVTAARRYADRATWLVRVTDQDGMFGLGEAAPLPGHGGEAPEMVKAALGELARALGGLIDPASPLGSATGDIGALGRPVGLEPEDIARISAAIRTAAPDAPCARAGIELALCDLAARRAGLPLARWLVAEACYEVPLNATIGGEPSEIAADQSIDAVRAGYMSIKVKVGTGDVADVERIAAVRAAVGDDVRIRADANGAWGRIKAESMCRAMAPFRLEYLEQPVEASDVEGLAALRSASIVPIAADEALLLSGGPEAVLERSAADVWVLKPSLMGGPLAALDIARLALHSGASIVVTSALDSAVGRAGAAHVAAALLGRGEVHACGLATGQMFVEDVAGGHLIESGRLMLSTSLGPGLGIGDLNIPEDAWRPASDFEA